MERVLSQEERIRRAEQLIELRRSKNASYRDDRVYARNNNTEIEVSKSGNFIIRKMIKQIVICLIVYTAFFVIKNQNFIFSQEFITKTKEILSYDVNFVEVYNNGITFLQGKYNLEQENQVVETRQEEKETEKESTKEEQTNKKEESNKEDKDNKEKTEEKVNDKEVTKTSETEKELSVMEKDALYIKKKISLTKPAEGYVSSEFGEREPDAPVVTEEHKGIDVAANTGTKIVAAMDGVVDIATTSSSYGKYIQITNEDVTTIYAHCSKLCVEKGDKVKKGQKIAEVGSTGASTGPHLHFEIKVSDRHINPRLVIEF